MTPTKEQTYILREDVEKMLWKEIHFCETMIPNEDLWHLRAIEQMNAIFRIGDSIQSLPTHKLPQTNEWISVDEKLPEEEWEYLVVDVYEIQFVCTYHLYHWFYSDTFYTDEITHWMNLPELIFKI